MTAQEAKLMAFIRTYIASSEGVTPTYDEMASAMGFRSKSGISRMVDQLVRKGRLRKPKSPGARGLEIVEPVLVLPHLVATLNNYCRDTISTPANIVEIALTDYFRARKYPIEVPAR